MATQALIRGDDYVLKIVVTTEAGGIIDITGDKMFFTCKTNKNDPDNLAIFQVTDIVPAGADATAGIHRIQIPNTLEVGTLHYDVQWKRDVSGTGNIITLPIDTFSVAQDVTLADT